MKQVLTVRILKNWYEKSQLTISEVLFVCEDENDGILHLSISDNPPQLMRCLIHPTTILIYTSYQMNIYLRTACFFRITDDEMRRNNFDVRLTFLDRRNPPRKWEPVFQCSNASTVAVSCPVLRRPGKERNHALFSESMSLARRFQERRKWETYPYVELDVFVRDSLDVESDGGNGSYGLVELQLVQDGWKWSSWAERDILRISKKKDGGLAVHETLTE